jgi:4-amino-4-deoxy-L-arabinose transferase-like glycosyltransferase
MMIVNDNEKRNSDSDRSPDAKDKQLCEVQNVNKCIDSGQRLRRLIILSLFSITVTLAVTSLIGDSITFDETSHITSGYSYLKTGDFRLGPDNPPLAQMWVALPLLFVDNVWPGPQLPCWEQGNQWLLGVIWLSELNDGESLAIYARLMMVVLLVLTCLCVYIIAKKLFGAKAALLALILSVFSPTFLAHGRLATTDLPFTLMILLSLLAFSNLLERITLKRYILTALALSGLCLTKFSWPAILPALVIMTLSAILSKRPIPLMLSSKKTAEQNVTLLTHKKSKAAVLVVILILTAIFIWAAIWMFFGFRYSPFLGPDAEKARMITVFQPVPDNMEQVWEKTLSDQSGEPIKGTVATLIRKARAGKWLPEAYLYGMAFIWKSIGTENYYFLGQISQQGWRLYLPVAFLIKTPVAIILLLVLGLIAILEHRRTIIKDMKLFAGLLGFTVFYAASAILSKYSIGHRHFVPVYPAVFVIASAALFYSRFPKARYIIPAAIIWLISANLWIHPHYLSYFNELIGGPERGPLFFAESNIDWGQDLKRLAKCAKAHPDEVIKLAYFGSTNPAKYGFRCENLHSTIPFEPTATLTTGTYVISVTHLLGVFYPGVSDSFWENPLNKKVYEQIFEKISQDSEEESQPVDEALRKSAEYLMRTRLISRLRKRDVDERIGYSMFVYRLTDEEVKELIKP